MIDVKYDECGRIIHNGDRYTAIMELHEKLKELDIDHGVMRFLDGYKLWVPATYDNSEFEGDVIQHYGSWGAEQNLLEVWGFGLEDPEGHLTVDQALEYFVKWSKERER